MPKEMVGVRETFKGNVVSSSFQIFASTSDVI
jgi:hypothetical protein